MKSGHNGHVQTFVSEPPLHIRIVTGNAVKIVSWVTRNYLPSWRYSLGKDVRQRFDRDRNCRVFGNPFDQLTMRIQFLH